MVNKNTEVNENKSSEKKSTMSDKTAYQNLIKQNHKEERVDFRWDTRGDELL